MQIGGDGGQLLIPLAVAEHAEHIARDVGAEADMAEPMLGISGGGQVLVRLPDVGLDFIIVPDLLEGWLSWYGDGWAWFEVAMMSVDVITTRIRSTICRIGAVFADY